MKKRDWGDILCMIAGISAILFVVMTAKMVLSLEGDNCPQTYALFVDVARAIHSDSFSLWNPYLWGGFSNIGHSITQAYYPINWILCNIFYHSDTGLVSYAVIPWNLAIHLTLYFTGMYFLVKKIGFSRLNAFCVGMMSTLCCSVFYYRYWVVYLDGFCWLPLIILSSVLMYEAEAGRKLRYSMALGILFAMEAMVSISMMLAIAVYILGAIFIGYLFGNSRKGIVDNLKYSVLAGVIGMFLAAPPLLNTLTFMKHLVRYVPDVGWLSWGVKFPIEEYAKHKYGFDNFLQMLDFKEDYELGVSMNAFILLFFSIGLFCRKKKNVRLFYISLCGAVVAGMASFGIIFPAAFYYVPGINQLREASMYAVFLNIFASVAAAYGFDTAEQVISAKAAVREEIRLPVLLGIVLLGLLGYNVLAGNAVCRILAFLAFMYSFLAWVKGSMRKSLFYLCTCLYVGISGVDFYHMVDLFTYTEPEAVRQVELACENTRTLVSYIENLDPSDKYYRMTDWGSDCYPVNMASVLGFYDVKGYLNPTFESAVSIHLGMPLDKRAQLQNIKYYLVRADSSPQVAEAFEADAGYTKAGEIEGIFSDYAGLNQGTVTVYQASGRLGPAWVAEEFEWNEDSSVEEILGRISGSSFSIGTTAILEKCELTEAEDRELAGMTPGAAAGSVVCREMSNNRVVYDVDAGSSGILVTADLYYPGWKVTVNGEKRTLLKVDGTNRGVVVPEGESIVEFRFSPPEFWIGIALQAAGAVLLLALAVRLRKMEKIAIDFSVRISYDNNA